MLHRLFIKVFNFYFQERDMAVEQTMEVEQGMEVHQDMEVEQGTRVDQDMEVKTCLFLNILI